MSGRIEPTWRTFYTMPCPRCEKDIVPNIQPTHGDPWVCHACGAIGQWNPYQAQKREESG